MHPAPSALGGGGEPSDQRQLNIRVPSVQSTAQFLMGYLIHCALRVGSLAAFGAGRHPLIPTAFTHCSKSRRARGLTVFLRRSPEGDASPGSVRHQALQVRVLIATCHSSRSSRNPDPHTSSSPLPQVSICWLIPRLRQTSATLYVRIHHEGSKTEILIAFSSQDFSSGTGEFGLANKLTI